MIYGTPHISKFNVSNALDKYKNIDAGILISLILSISFKIKSTNLTLATSVECCDLKPYCCSDKRLLTLK